MWKNQRKFFAGVSLATAAYKYMDKKRVQKKEHRFAEVEKKLWVTQAVEFALSGSSTPIM